MLNTKESNVNHAMDAKIMPMYQVEAYETANIGLYLTYKKTQEFHMLHPNSNSYTGDNLLSTLSQLSLPTVCWMREIKLNKRFINCDTKLFAC